MLSSARRAIVYPNTNRSDTADVPRDIFALVQALEIDVVYGQGTLAARPVSTAGSPGLQGRLYVATDQTPHAFYYDYGTGWDPVGALAAGSVGTVQLADGSVTTIKIADLNVTTAKIADLNVTTGKIAANAVGAGQLATGLFPSQGAGAGTEAFRALGTGAANAAAGNDSRLSDQRTPTDGSVTAAKLAPQTINVQGGSYSLVLSDRFKAIRMDGGGTLTIPTNAAQAFNVGDTVDVIQWGASQVTIAGAGGVTVVGNPGLKTAGQYVMASLLKIATDTWVAVGGLTP